jgi:hypothetical protein
MEQADWNSQAKEAMSDQPIPDEVFKPSPLPRHQLGEAECLVLHRDRWGNQLPQCRMCRVCKEWIHYFDRDSACFGEKE